MLLAILSICSEEELEDSSDSDSDRGETGRTDADGDAEMRDRTARTLGLSTPAEVARRRQEIKSKIIAVGRLQRVFQLLRCVCCLFPSDPLTPSFALPSLRGGDKSMQFILINDSREEAESASELVDAESGESGVSGGLGVQRQIRQSIHNFEDACVSFPLSLPFLPAPSFCSHPCPSTGLGVGGVRSLRMSYRLMCAGVDAYSQTETDAGSVVG
jgi:serine/threonine-protein phosphatase 2B catalytic subunit